MTKDPTQAWLNNAGRYPLLPGEEMIRLANLRDSQVPGSKAYIKTINKISRHNLRLVPNVVRKYLAKRKDFSMASDVTPDLLQQGYIGLRRAAEKYDASRGFSFSTYAYPWIYQSVTRWHNSRDRLVYIPENAMTETLYRLRHGEPSKSKNGKISDEVILSARRCFDIGSTDINSNDNEDGTTLADVMSDEHRIHSNKSTPTGASIRKIQKLMDECGIRSKVQEIVLLKARYGRMSTVASKLKMSPGYCGAVFNEAVRTMQTAVETKESAKSATLAGRLSK